MECLSCYSCSVLHQR